MSLSDILKNTLLILLLLQFAPSLIENIYTQYSHYIKPRTKVGLITLHETITSSAPYNKNLHTYFQDPEIKAILLKIDCSGGCSGSSQALHNDIKLLKKEYPKPLIVLVENTCASGAYYIASTADHIIAPGTALIGSIGACLPYLFHVKAFMEQFKITSTPIKAGAYKSCGDPFTDASAQEIALLQGVVTDTYQQFAADVAANRKLAMSTMTTWADGKVFSGRQALALGLIDELGSSYTAIKIIKEKALIEGDIEWVKPPQESTWSTLLGTDKDTEGETMFSGMANAVCNYLETRYGATTIKY